MPPWIGRGVPARMIKWRGVGKRAAIISATAADNIREGDRKVLLERLPTWIIGMPWIANNPNVQIVMKMD